MKDRGVGWSPVILGTLVAIVAGCGQPGGGRTSARKPVESPRLAQTAPQPPRLRVETHGVRELSWQSNGKYIMRARADSFVADEETGKARLRRAKAILYKNGKEAASISADSIEADAKTETLSATGGTVVRSFANNTSLRAGKIVWRHGLNKFSGSEGISVKSDAGVLRADTMEGDTTLKEIELRSDKGGVASVNATALKLSL